MYDLDAALRHQVAHITITQLVSDIPSYGLPGKLMVLITQEEALARVSVGDVWNVGPRYSEMLQRNGIKTALAMRDADDEWIRKRMTITGLRTFHELRGVQRFPFIQTPKAKQQLCVSRSFGSPTESLQDLRAAVAFFTARVAEKLREYRLIAGELSVFVHTDRFKNVPQYAASRSLTVAPKSDSALELMPLALKGLNQVYREGYGIRKAGVILNDLKLADSAPRRLWDASLYELHKRLMANMDAINAKFGKGALNCGLFPSSGAWKTRFERKSPAYTTDWRQLMTTR
jgi:DNA polymerase V